MERSLALSIIYQRRTLLAVSSYGLSISYCLDCLIIKIVLFTSLMCLLHRYVKIPWSKFILGSRGRIQDKQSVVPLEVIILFFSPARARAGPKGLRAESARAFTGRRNSHRWEGGRLFEPSAGFFYGNSCNFGTKSRKIVSKVGN